MRIIKVLKIALASFIVLVGLISFAHAAPLPVSIVTGSAGSYNNSDGLLTDNTFAVEGSVWTGSTNVWWYDANSNYPVFYIMYDDIYRLEDMIVSVDNNDNYNVDYFNYSANSWFSLFSILSEYGNVTWGMDTFVIQTEIGFTPVNTDFIRIYGNGGDGMYAISEVWAWGSPISTPEPATMLLLGLGLLGLVGVRRKTQK